MNASNSQAMVMPPRSAVFCTALVDADPRRYQSWIDYYTRFFDGENVDLWLYNDGPVKTQLDLKGATVVSFDATLGRESLWVFPGWKRSFSTAVRELGAQYRYLAHVESDTIILDRGRKEFLYALRRPGYRTGYSSRHHFVETALQIINTPCARKFFCDRYPDLPSFYHDEWFEIVVQYDLRPKLILHGERVEDDLLSDLQDYTYLSQLPVYRFCEEFLPRINSSSLISRDTNRLRNCHNEVLRLRWAVRSALWKLKDRVLGF